MLVRRLSTKMEYWRNARHKRDQGRAVWFKKRDGVVGRKGEQKKSKKRNVRKITCNNTENDMDSQNIGQVAASETKRDIS